LAQLPIHCPFLCWSNRHDEWIICDLLLSLLYGIAMWILQWFNHFQSSVNMFPIPKNFPPISSNKKYSGCHWFLSNFFFQWITFSFGQQKILRMSLVFI
jgi:hypothetical protein